MFNEIYKFLLFEYRYKKLFLALCVVDFVRIFLINQFRCCPLQDHRGLHSDHVGSAKGPHPRTGEADPQRRPIQVSHMHGENPCLANIMRVCVGVFGLCACNPSLIRCHGNITPTVMHPAGCVMLCDGFPPT